MHCKKCDICSIGYVCRQADVPESRCPVEGATEDDTVKIDYEEE